MSLLGLVLPWWGRWAAIAALAAAIAGVSALKMHEHDQAKYDARELEIQLAAAKQDQLTKAIVATQQTKQRSAQDEADTLRGQRDAALFAANRMRAAAAHRSLLPTAAATAPSGARLCYSPGELDREILEALGRARAGDQDDAVQGQAGVDLASTCRDWQRGLAAKPSP